MSNMVRMAVRAATTKLDKAADEICDDHEYANAYSAVRRCCARGGTVWLVGVGKSALLASRVAATWCSIGLPARSEDATSMLHGGLGGVRDEDVCILISKSGRTDECINLADVLFATRATVLWASERHGSEIRIPIVAEMDIGNAVPTCSLAMTGIVLDAIGLLVADDRGFTRADFVRSHPGGLGSREAGGKP